MTQNSTWVVKKILYNESFTQFWIVPLMKVFTPLYIHLADGHPCNPSSGLGLVSHCATRTSLSIQFHL